MKLASQASALDCMGELGVCVMVFVVKAHDARLAHLIHNFLTYLHHIRSRSLSNHGEANFFLSIVDGENVTIFVYHFVIWIGEFSDDRVGPKQGE